MIDEKFLDRLEQIADDEILEKLAVRAHLLMLFIQRKRDVCHCQKYNRPTADVLVRLQRARMALTGAFEP